MYYIQTAYIHTHIQSSPIPSANLLYTRLVAQPKLRAIGLAEKKQRLKLP
jgi:hypothetical protein